MDKKNKHIFNNNLEFRFSTDHTLSNWLATFFLLAASTLGYALGKPIYGIGIGCMIGIGVYYKYLQRKTVLFLVNDEIKIIYNDNCLIISPEEILRIENKETANTELMKFFFINPQISAFEVDNTFACFKELKENILNSHLHEKLITNEDCPKTGKPNQIRDDIT